MLWWHKKEEITSKEYDKIKKELDNLNNSVVDLESLLLKISADYKNIKGMLKKKILDSLSLETEDSKDLSNTMLLPDDGFTKYNRKRN